MIDIRWYILLGNTQYNNTNDHHLHEIYAKNNTELSSTDFVTLSTYFLEVSIT